MHRKSPFYPIYVGADILAHEIEDSETATSESETDASDTDSADAYEPYMSTVS